MGFMREIWRVIRNRVKKPNWNKNPKLEKNPNWNKKPKLEQKSLIGTNNPNWNNNPKL